MFASLFGLISNDIAIDLGTANSVVAAKISAPSCHSWIGNTGTAALDAVQFSSTPPSGWTVTFDPPTVQEVKPNESTQVVALIKPAKNALAGDYAIGSNHVLPTAGAARVRGGLSAADFVRQITVQRLSERGLRRIGRTVIDLATAEGLKGHADSIAVRLQ